MTYIYNFQQAPSSLELLGNKGLNLVTMKRLGLPVPNGVIVTTAAYNAYMKNGRSLPTTLQTELSEHLKGAHDGLFAVRSSSPYSMPGVLTTVLNVKKDAVAQELLRVFESWDSPQADFYRELFSIPYEVGVSVVIQEMVVGDGLHSGSGVVFTRNPITGERGLFGEYLPNSSGLALVNGTTTPYGIERLELEHGRALYDELDRVGRLLELHYKDMQDIEFTVEQNRLFILQTRSGKRNLEAAINIAVDLVDESVLTIKEALSLVDPTQLQKYSGSCDVNGELLTTGIAASSGVAVGELVFDSFTAQERSRLGRAVVLVRLETSVEDIAGIEASVGVLTLSGGATSHAAVITRGMNKPSVVGCKGLELDEESKTLKSTTLSLKEGDEIAVDGTNGRVFYGKISTSKLTPNYKMQRFLDWLKQV